METVSSFKVDHRTLKAGVYLRDQRKVLGIVPIRVWDIRFVAPSDKKKIPAKAAHVLEHMFAYYLRIGSFSNKVISVNMMGCGTGMYVETLGWVSKKEVVENLKRVVTKDFPLLSQSLVPGMTAESCGNPVYFNIPQANEWAEVLKGILQEI